MSINNEEDIQGRSKDKKKLKKKQIKKKFKRMKIVCVRCPCQ